ncbi:MAG: flap structure-specific endonuclease [Candidatus Woesearchaeota archaeon]
MGVKIKDLVEENKKIITLDQLKNKILVVDAFNMLYQFITTIRQADGTPLQDEAGITSHLSGIIYRVTNILSKGIKLIFVFETESPELKRITQMERKAKKQEAIIKYELAKESHEIEEMKRYAMESASLSASMIEESKELLTALGCAIIEMPFEGEAIASQIVKKGIGYAVVSQDYDSLLFGAKRLVRNLSISQRRKEGEEYKKVDIELIELDEILKKYNINQDQLIVIGMLAGSDFTPGGVPGIGCKKALKLIHEYGNNFDALFESIEWNKYYSYSWKDVFSLFKKEFEIPKIEFPHYDRTKVIKLLCEKHKFSQERIEKVLSEMEKENSQLSLNKWF